MPQGYKISEIAYEDLVDYSNGKDLIKAGHDQENGISFFESNTNRS